MTALLVIILLIFGLPYLWRLLRPYFYRWVQNLAADYMRKAMGMPPRDQKRQSTRQDTASQRSAGGGYYTRRKASGSGPVIPKEYAEDVEFTEYHSYSSDTIAAEDSKSQHIVVESQVSDAEIIEIKKEK